MTYASDKLYNEVLRKGRMSGRLATTVKVREIVPHLPCLTLSDREEIEAKRETVGNYNAVILMLDCLRRRQDWPEQLITALGACEHSELADELSNAYNKIRGIKTEKTAPTAAAAASASGPAPAASTPAAPPATPPPAPAPAPAPAPVTSALVTPSPAPSPATTVTTATVHNAPSYTSPLLTPSPVEAPTQAAASAPAHPTPESLPNIATSSPAEAPASVPTQEATAPPPPEPAQPSEPSPPLSTSQASPSSVSAPTMTPSLKQNELSSNTEVTPSSDSSDDLTPNPPEATSAAAPSLPTNTVTPPSQPAPSTSVEPSAVSEESKIPLAVTESSTSVKCPIQDTNPPERVTVLTQDLNTSSTVSQPVEAVQTTVLQNSQPQTPSPETAQVLPSASNDAVEGHLSHTAAVGEEYFSKPGTLMEPREEQSLDSYNDLQISRPPTVMADSSPVQPARPTPVSSRPQPEELSEEPCSVSSNDLMFSRDTTPITSSSEVHNSQHSPTEQMDVPVSHPTAAADNVLPHSTPEENSFPEGDAAFSNNQPVEDYYESICQSLQTETLVNIVHVSEEPSILNLNAQTPSMIGNAIHRNHNEISLDHTSQAESPLMPVMSEDQPRTLQDQGITQCTQSNEDHANNWAGSAGTSTCQDLRSDSSGLINSHQPEQRDMAENVQGVLSHLQHNPRLMVAAAAVGVALLAWKLKH